jgi:hypothetical protein
MCVNKNLKKKKAKDVTLSDEIFNVSWYNTYDLPTGKSKDKETCAVIRFLNSKCKNINSK